MIATDYLKKQLKEALIKIAVDTTAVEIVFDRPKNPEHGDLATNVAMLLASQLHKNPRQIAQDLIDKLDLDDRLIARVEIAGAGFMNFFLNEQYYREALREIRSQNTAYGQSSRGCGRKVLFEFVSANPTGPLNVVSARAAAVGDVLANLFNAVGYDARREYYVNDAGRQVKLLAKSVSSRYMKLVGKHEPFPEEGYHGDYIKDLAQEILNEMGPALANLDAEARWLKLGDIALKKILSSQQKTLDDYRVRFDVWYSEKELREKNEHDAVLEQLTKNGHVYEKDGAKWFKAAEFGDEKDRVLVTGEGEPTYFLVDVAYHANKYKRGFKQLYDLWGPDHHGYIERMKAALKALGFPAESFDVLIIQQVNLLHEGEVVKMSKRAGKIIEMAELIEEVGVDVARYFFLARRTQSPLDFDMDLAKNTSEENPVYYVQYAHARICNILKHADEHGRKIPADHADLSLLQEDEEMLLIKKLLDFPNVVSGAAKFMEPHRLPNYLQELAAVFHRFYHHCKVVSSDENLTGARLFLVDCARIVFLNALTLMGIHAPERM